MMRSKVHWIPVVLLVFTASFSAQAQLPNRFEIAKNQYLKDRSDGLVRLNEKYILAYRTELENATKAKRLAEASEILGEIEKLQAEIKALQAPAAGKSKFSLVGKMISFGAEASPRVLCTLEFKSGGKAVFVGLNKRPAEWKYEQSEDPSVFYIWDIRKEKEEGWSLQVNDDQKSGKVRNLRSVYVADAVITEAP